MPTSQNGWPANDRSLIQSYPVPGGSLTMRKGDVATILQWIAVQYHDRVQPLKWPGCWGYAEKTITGSNTTTLSNHASGTAIDLNAPAHPQGTAISANYTPAQIAAIHEIVNFCDGVIRWGGDYTRSKIDGMHFEINVQPDDSRIAALVQKLQSATDVSPANRTPPAPADTSSRAPDHLPTVRQGDMNSGWVSLLQQILNLKADGDFGPNTTKAVKALQRSAGLPQDGIVGMQTWCLGLLAVHGILAVGENEDSPVIELLQNLVGFRGADLDRNFGPATKARVQEVQRWGSLAADGIVGPQTRTIFARG